MTGAPQLTLGLELAVPALPALAPAPCSASFKWQWHGRQMFTELRNDFRFPRKLHRVVYHFSDLCEAPDEAAARATFERDYPDAQTLGFFCIGPVKQPKRRMSPNAKLTDAGTKTL